MRAGPRERAPQRRERAESQDVLLVGGNDLANQFIAYGVHVLSVFPVREVPIRGGFVDGPVNPQEGLEPELGRQVGRLYGLVPVQVRNEVLTYVVDGVVI